MSCYFSCMVMLFACFKCDHAILGRPPGRQGPSDGHHRSSRTKYILLVEHIEGMFCLRLGRLRPASKTSTSRPTVKDPAMVAGTNCTHARIRSQGLEETSRLEY